MAIHGTISSMAKEALIETFLVAQYCVKFEKDPRIWGASGCYGYPAAKLLFSIVDTIGSYVIDNNDPRQHFKILNHPDYYNLGLSEEDLKIIYENYRSLLEHNSVMPFDHFLNIGNADGKVFEIVNNKPTLNLLPFLLLTKKILEKFLPDLEKIISESKKMQDILKK